jgi:hypothetical protein
MDEETLKQLVKEFSARVWWGEQQLKQRQEVIASLEQNGRDARSAIDVLRRFEKAHAGDVAELRRLEMGLADLRRR